MTPTSDDNHYERTDPATVEDTHGPVIDALKLALQAEDGGENNDHLREALQLLRSEDRDEPARIVNSALDAEDADEKSVLVREVIELLRIENKVASATRTNEDERAK